MAGKGRSIVVTVDEGDHSTYALTWCLKNLVVNHNSQDTLILLYAKPRPPASTTTVDSTGYLFSSDIVDTMDQYSNQVAQNVLDKANRICKDNDDTVKVETMVEVGDPSYVICEASERLKADFLVMGSHGYGLIKRALLGSVSSHCAQNAKCPVVIVKTPNQN